MEEMINGEPAFEVLYPGVLTTIQDMGRYGFSQFGVPMCGALDTFSLRIGNILVGNNEDDACLEITVIGPTLKVKREVVIAITGGDLSPTLNEEPLEMWMAHILVEGDVISFKKLRAGCRSYMAVSGGFSVPKIMGSRSTYLSGGFGGVEGRALRQNDILFISNKPLPLDRLGIRFPKDFIPIVEREVVLHVIPGPQDNHFTKEGSKIFYSSTYQVTPKCNRMGIRLEGPKIDRRPDMEESIISEGLIPGSIQVPGDGKPIIILTEMVTGGYSKIATIISTDLQKVAQIKPGDNVRFKPVSIEEAHCLLREQEEKIEKFKDLISSHSIPSIPKTPIT